MPTPGAPGGSPPAANPSDKTKDFLLQPPSVSLPKGGGAIHGMGEKFAANPVTGTASFGIPVALSPGRGGAGPQFSLSYNSGSGNGPFGLGFSGDVPSIRRKTDKGLPQYRDPSDSDVYVFSEAEDLSPKLVFVEGVWVPDTLTSGAFSVRRYRPRVEVAFARIERWTSTVTGDVHWQTVGRDNTRRFYGETTAARVIDPDQPRHIFEWLLERTEDELGNVTAYEYKAEDQEKIATHRPAERARRTAYTYLKRLLYGNATPFVAGNYAFEAVFDYGEHTASPPTPSEDIVWPVRLDPFSSFRSGFDMRCYRLCRRVLMFHRISDLSDDPVLVKTTSLTYEEGPKFSRLVAVEWAGYDTTGVEVVTESLPPLAFGYTQPVIDETVRFVTGLEDLSGGFSPGRFQWVDLDGEGLTGLLSEQAGSWFYKASLGEGKLAPLQRLGSRPNISLGGSANRLMDVEGDGRLDVVQLTAPYAGFFARSDGGWEPFRRFSQLPNLPWNDPNVRFVDLDGDGHPDILVMADDCLWFYPSQGKNGYGNPLRVWKPGNENDGPKVVFSNTAEAILLADMTGDGLTDIVRVRNGTISYYPNKGYGQFGHRVLMSDAPWFDAPERFDASRLRLSDIDGSGTTDLIYLGPDAPRLWFNHAGNGWSAETKLARFPSVASHATIEVADIEGSGTACLVWNSALPGDLHRPLRYIRLMAEGKPHLLKTITNHLGAETRLTYTPSTVFYVADRRAGKPWATRLPFPVQCLTKTERVDHVTGWKFTQTYAYHHGYYDGLEREFRGFGLVEQFDTEVFSAFEDPDAANSALEFHQPPVRTKTWFHTGAWRDDLLAAFANEYWSGNDAAAILPKTSLPSGLTVAEQQEAARALKGQALRSEVYADDGTADAGKPYTVVENRYEVRRVQPAVPRPNKSPLPHGRDPLHHAAFLVVPREVMTWNYERNAADPRVAHALTLAVDAYGTVLRSAAVSYPRRASQSPTTEQQQLHVVASTTSVIHDDATAATYHVGVPFESATFELTGVSYTEASPPTPAEVDADLGAATDLAFEGTPTGGSTRQRRRLGHDRTLYWNDALTAPLAAGTLGARVLPYERYRLALTSGLLTAVYDGDVTPTMLSEEGGYIDLLSDGDSWVRSGFSTLDPDHFYHPTATTDVWGNVTTLTWDAYDLFVIAVEAPKVAGATAATGLTTTATVDYRVLQPWRVTDPNGTKSEAAFDALGRVVKTAVTGREGEGDDLATSPGTELTYEVFRWKDEGLPNRVHTKVRETHGGSTFLESYAYSDGSGNVAMVKTEAASIVVGGGPAAQWIGSGRTVVDNKGNPVKQYEPYFSGNFEYENEDDLVATGVTPLLKYDPLGRNIQTTLPNHTFRKVVFSGWHQETWDENDTVTQHPVPDYEGETSWYEARMALADGDPEKRAAELAAAHADTPTVAWFDALGRPYQTDETPDGTLTYTTTVTLDVQGNPRVLTDARGNATQSQTFDVLGRPMLTASPDAGDTVTFLDAAGQPCRTWKAGNLALRATYDAMRRSVGLWVTEDATERLVQLTVYGEVLPTEDAEDGYLLGKPFRVYDTAGCVTNTAYDFKGNTLASNRRTLADVDALPDWSAADGETDPDAIETAVNAALNSETFESSSTYDALNRPVTHTTPDASVTTNTYDEGGKLFSVTANVRGALTATPVVESLTYNAKGQRIELVAGSGVTTTYSYDAATFRLARLVSVRTSGPNTLQDLAYHYDPVGNIVEVTDSAQDTLYFDNAEVEPTQTYVYDALYRLTQANGRENAANGQTNWEDPAKGDIPSDVAVRNYRQSFAYDGVGNITQVSQFTGSGLSSTWKRFYQYAEASNRLLRTSIPGDDEEDPDSFSHAYAYNDRGAMTAMPHLAAMGNDFRDQMRTVDLGSGDEAVYHYDGGGQRVRKVVRRGANTEDTLYLGGYEVYRKSVGGTLDAERQTLHVMDDQRRVLLVETLTVEDEDVVLTPTPRFRFQLDNHLGTACVEVTESGEIISYEEYYPYGSTSWHARDGAIEVSAKRYRYTGKEKDDETGLYYHGARHMAPWLGRWTAADPIGAAADGDRYAFCNGRPLIYADRNGNEPSGDISVPGLETVPGREDTVTLRSDLQVLARKLLDTAPQEAGQEIALYVMYDADDALYTDLGLPAKFGTLLKDRKPGTAGSVNIDFSGDAAKTVLRARKETGHTITYAGIFHTHPPLGGWPSGKDLLTGSDIRQTGPSLNAVFIPDDAMPSSGYGMAVLSRSPVVLAEPGSHSSVSELQRRLQKKLEHRMAENPTMSSLSTVAWYYQALSPGRDVQTHYGDPFGELKLVEPMAPKWYAKWEFRTMERIAKKAAREHPTPNTTE